MIAILVAVIVGSTSYKLTSTNILYHRNSIGEGYQLRKLIGKDDDFGSDFIFVEKVNAEAEARRKSMQQFQSLRETFMWDSIFACFLGVSIVWYFGALKDVYSYCFGSILGLSYAFLMSKYVETLGPNGAQRGGSGGGSLRFVPVILLIVVFGKYKDSISLLPELLGFFTYKVSSVLQIFNEDAYNRKELSSLS
jgi:hypothetical protein